MYNGTRQDRASDKVRRRNSGGFEVEIKYQRTMRQSFMVVLAGADMPEYHFHMCRGNHIKHFLEFDVVKADGKTENWYNITGKQALGDYLKENKPDWRFLNLFIAALKDCADCIDLYLLDEAYVMLEPEMIYMGADGEEVFFCYGIFARESLAEQFRHFMEFLLTKLDHGERSAVELGYLVYQKTLEPNYTVEDIWGLLEQRHTETFWEEESALREPENTVIQERQKGDNKSEDKARIMFWEKAAAFLQTKKAELIQKWSVIGRLKRREGREKYRMVFTPEDIQREVSGNTELLSEREAGVLRFLGEQPGRDIFLDRGSVTVGSGKEVDIPIQVNSVSRLHARITVEGSSCYLEDLNSRNGTKVNGKLLNYKERVEVSEGDTIELAGEQYCFELI